MTSIVMIKKTFFACFHQLYIMCKKQQQTKTPKLKTIQLEMLQLFDSLINSTIIAINFLKIMLNSLNNDSCIINTKQAQIKQMISPLIKFTTKQMNEFLDICTDSYASSNPFILLNIQTPQQFREQTEKVIGMFVEADEYINMKLRTDVWFNTYFRLDGVMVRAGFSCQLYYYMKVICKTEDYDFYQELIKMDLSEIREGEAVVSIREVTHKDYYKRGLMKYGLIQKSKHLISKGYIYDFIWTSNPVSYKVNAQLGAQVLKSFDSKIKNADLKIYIMKRDMRKTAQMNVNIVYQK